MTHELYLIRHGESQMNTQGHLVGGRSNETPLTNLGLAQATRLGEYFLAHAIIPDHVFASPAVRTLQTSCNTLAALKLNREPTIADEIQEMDQGEYVGRERTTVYTPAVLQAIQEQGKDFKLPGGESMNGVGSRMLRWIETTVAVDDASDSRTFVFGHGLAIRSLVSVLENWSHRETFESVTDNTSVTLLVHQDDNWNVQYIGETPHLDELSRS